jgi:hypothetical protein
MRTITVLTLLSVLSLNAADLTITAGLPVTPNRTATDTYSNDHIWNQESRIGPSAGLMYRKWLGKHSGIFGETDWSNTNTRLGDYSVNTWTMNRITIDGGYTYHWLSGHWSPYVKAGVGCMVFMSGMAQNGTSAGLDNRMEELAGAGVSYRLSKRFGAVLEYNARFLRNPDFNDHTWHPQRNVISAPAIGISYTFGSYEPQR